MNSLIRGATRCTTLLFRRSASKHYTEWKVPYSLDDEWNLAGTQPDIYTQWKNESPDIQDISRLPKHLKVKLSHRREWIPVRHVSETSLAYQRAAYARFGSLSDIDPSVCWPTPEELQMHAEMAETFETDVEETVKELKESEERRKQEMMERQAKIVENMKRMPKLIAAFKGRQDRKKLQQERREKRRRRMVIEARDHFGYDVDPRDDKFKKLMAVKAEEEERRRKEEKRLKKKQRRRRN